MIYCELLRKTVQMTQEEAIAVITEAAKSDVGKKKGKKKKKKKK